MLTNRQTGDFFKSLGLTLHAGITVADGLFLLAGEEKENKTLFENMGRAMDAGRTLAQAMKESGAFDEVAVGIVQAGNATGRTEAALNYMAKFYYNKEATNKRIKNALAYPCMVMGFMLVVVGLLLVKILPVFNSVYLSLGIEMTGLAAFLLKAGNILGRFMPALAVLMALFIGAYLLYRFNPAVNSKVKAYYNRNFADKGIGRKFNNAAFSQAIAMGMYSGMTLQQAGELGLKILADIPTAAARREKFCADMARYKETAQSLEENGLLPVAESRMLALGIRSGNGDMVMADIAERMDVAANEALETAVSRIEPVMVLTASILIGVILVSVMLPLVNILSAMG